MTDETTVSDNLETLLNHILIRPGLTSGVNYHWIRVVLKPDFTIEGKFRRKNYLFFISYDYDDKARVLLQGVLAYGLYTNS